ncbi:mechanosensitive ion channel protein MscS [Halorubrum ezzemoulense DSM 17463]|uniref:Mechanosensitive ion channel protein MscS n=2 Tax=Halorubrum ezzemoulense TaxID=337243 RepID=A0A1X4HC44_HALEZ|nr:mechanosensitive ion channel domain-containing protein [Halorubrum ezzemoulense]OSP10799.1 mechanosensitive ion channel protein MscS [Halorubrum ezzemoulense DSM 17463]OYR70237.1 mechanosensitive ion channel protein MscS [Halorubrum ezzemoulense]
MTQIPSLVSRSLSNFVEGLVVAVPRLLSGLIFLALAYLTVRVVLSVVHGSIERLYVGDRELVGDLIVTLVSVFLWFGVALTFLKVVGMGDIAASLGTAVGFIALGVSYALSEMIEDTVAGVYLLRDPDFNVGYRVESKGVTGTVAAIELRKTRIDTDGGDRIVMANREIEPRWTHDVPEETTGGAVDEPTDSEPSTTD